MKITDSIGVSKVIHRAALASVAALTWRSWRPQLSGHLSAAGEGAADASDLVADLFGYLAAANRRR